MSSLNAQFLKNKIVNLGFTANDDQINQFLLFYNMLVEKNKVMNLTAITEFEDVVNKHFIDSLSLIKAVDLSGTKKLIDIGTGAGFPGLPLKIIFPELEITLLDSLNKRVMFLNEVINELHLKNVEAVHSRAEDLARDWKYREQYDICVSRAVSNLSTLSELCLPFVKTGGLFISYKSEKIVQEAKDARKAILVLGGDEDKQVELILPKTEIYRNLYVIKKIKGTPKIYPRKAGTPAKNPL